MRFGLLAVIKIISWVLSAMASNGKGRNNFGLQANDKSGKN